MKKKFFFLWSENNYWIFLNFWINIKNQVFFLDNIIIKYIFTRYRKNIWVLNKHFSKIEICIVYRPSNFKNTYLQMFILIRKKIKYINIYKKQSDFFSCIHSIDRDFNVWKKTNYKSCVNFTLNNTATN